MVHSARFAKSTNMTDSEFFHSANSHGFRRPWLSLCASLRGPAVRGDVDSESGAGASDVIIRNTCMICNIDIKLMDP